ncbi:MAG: MASE1 domain-containing protein, partial [Caulobacteraceae bacterium]|nr:MASE1 domain-containing protein [Caulobacteraceae bacterium]
MIQAFFPGTGLIRPPAGQGPLAQAMQSAAVGLTVFVLTFLSLAFTRSGGRPPTLWCANAFALVCLARAPAQRWPGLLIAAGGGLMAASILQTPLLLSLRASVSDLAEVAAGAAALRRLCGRRIDLSRPRTLLVFAGIAILIPAISGMLMAATAAPFQFARLGLWYCAHALGILVFTPVLLALRPRVVQRLLAQPLDVALLAGFTAALFALLDQHLIPPHAAILALVVLVTFRMEQTGAAISAFLTTVVATGFMLAEARAHQGAETVHSLLVQQSALAITTSCALAIGATLAHRRRLKAALKMSLATTQAAHAATLTAMRQLKLADQALRASEARYRLLADHSSDIIVRVDLQDTLLYVSPSCRSMGYQPEELIGGSWLDLIHPEEAEALKAYRDALAQGRESRGSWEH